jgi:hypothetical protein
VEIGGIGLYILIETVIGVALTSKERRRRAPKEEACFYTTVLRPATWASFGAECTHGKPPVPRQGFVKRDVSLISNALNSIFEFGRRIYH